MSDEARELKTLLEAFRKGNLSEEILLERISAANREPEQDVGDGDSGSVAGECRGVEGLLVELDACRAAEASGSSTLESWAELTSDPVLEGGLRTAAAREATHALLLERRIRELDMKPTATVPDWLARFNAAILDAQATDLDRLGAMVAQFPDPERALEPLDALIEAVSNDPLTRELLVTIRDDERVTLRWMHESYQRLRRVSSGGSGRTG